MKRRNFIRTAGIAAAGSLAAPYLLPSGRLFASTGSKKVNHVVLCLLGGGVRNLESVQKAEGNLMPNLFAGNEKISSEIEHSLFETRTKLNPSLLKNPLQSYGTLFKNFRYNEGPTGHYNAHVAALTGRYSEKNLSIDYHPEFPTIFEYVRKHSLQQPENISWYISSSPMRYPSSAHSTMSEYGASFGSHFLSPQVESIANNRNLELKNFTMNEAIPKRASIIQQLVSGHNQMEGSQMNDEIGISNKFSAQLNKTLLASNNNPWGLDIDMSKDMNAVFYAEEVLKSFQPELTVVNLMDADVCHYDFSNYCDSLQHTDYAIAHLWETIQSTQGMMNNTIMIVTSEQGRNANPNSICDLNGRYGFDHTASLEINKGDAMAREVFCLVTGPAAFIKQNHVIDDLAGETTEIVPFITHALGIENEISKGMIKPSAQSEMQRAFV